jgi:hypothetical protein
MLTVTSGNLHEKTGIMAKQKAVSKAEKAMIGGRIKSRTRNLLGF